MPNARNRVQTTLVYFAAFNSSSSPKEYVVNLLANERSQAEEFAVDPMQDGLETVSFAWVFTVK